MSSVKTLVFGLICGYVLYQVTGTVMYTIKVAEFYGVDWNWNDLHIALNGRTAFGNQISIASDLAVVTPESGGGSIEEWCPGVSSERGFLSLGFVGDTAVCCSAEEDQWLVPFKDVDGQRHYLCGAWPNLDHVVRNLDDVVINVES